MSFSIEGKTAIVTGAANGIGLAIAQLFAKAGAKVMLADMDEDKLTAETETLAANYTNVRYFAGDLRAKLTTANLLSATVDAFDRVDILVNASRQVLPSNPLEPKEDSFDAMLQQNVLANLRLSQLIAKRFIQQAEDEDNISEASIGAIVNLTSIAADRTHPQLLGYSVACAALNQMTRSLAVSFAQNRIRVNAVAIGSVHSANLETAMIEDPDLRDAIIAATPMHRIAQPSEAAEVAQFLASDSAGFMTGQIVTVDGGRTLIDPVQTAQH
ncbi:oxidoreductase [Amylibacter ulvae]|uniref:Oxidoreductase n=1 Tax=Paramylibacter ulvae TaxID=1651968 RepID=A0ABQ3D5H5_9RHOB|nr:SDR family oxidoreductase [Amylibacter ulvae]GHA57823.1 oxidoreductase [Amylibacter ulvae]